MTSDARWKRGRGRRWRPFLCGVVLIVASACANDSRSDSTSPSLSPSSDNVAPPGFAEWITGEMVTWDIPGASVAVIEDYGVAWSAGFGLADVASGDAVTPSTSFQAASVSKPFAALAALLAYQEHGLSVDEDVNAFLGSVSADSASGGWVLPNPYATPVTMRMLLSHTGGTNDFHYSGYRRGVDQIPTTRQELDGAPPATTPTIEVVREPGSTWAYSPAGITVVQAILEDLYDRPFNEIMDDLVLDPVGLERSSFAQPAPAEISAAMAVPYLPDGSPLPEGPLVFNTEASGGLTTTPTELAELLIAIQRALAGDADGPIPVAIAEAMMVRQAGRTAPDHCIPTADPDASACESSWGLGFDVNLDEQFNHVPDGEPTGNWFGHTGFNTGYLTFALASKSGGNGVVVMVNMAPADMSGAVPQGAFMQAVVKRVAVDQGWS